MINVKEIKTSVTDFTCGGDGTKNATQVFMQKFVEEAKKVDFILKNDGESMQNLVKQLDELAAVVMNYRYNIVDYSHYSSEVSDYLSHKYIRV